MSVILLCIMILVLVCLFLYDNKEYFSTQKYKIITIKNNNCLFFYLKSLNNNDHKIYKIYK